MRVDAAIIGGTGIGESLRALSTSSIHVPTPFGTMRARLIRRNGRIIAAVSRHSAGHKTPPHRVNYRAIACGIAKLGARACFASAAVGSLRDDWPTGTLALCSDFLDLTARNLSLFDREVVHTDFSTPFGDRARECILEGAAECGIPIEPAAVYVNGNGPRYETPHEIQVYRRLGDVVGMTAASEAIAMKEAGVPYACLAVVTNLACGIAGAPLSHEEVVDAMQSKGEAVLEILLCAVDRLGTSP